MRKETLNSLIENLKAIYKSTPEIFKPIEEFYEVNIEEKLNDNKVFGSLSY